MKYVFLQTIREIFLARNEFSSLEKPSNKFSKFKYDYILQAEQQTFSKFWK